jgi:electron transfer flavoprotein alpha subunit
MSPLKEADREFTDPSGSVGAFQHMAGIAGAGTVIAVNKDKKAPIFRAADYGAVADALDIVTALKTELRKN